MGGARATRWRLCQPAGESTTVASMARSRSAPLSGRVHERYTFTEESDEGLSDRRAAQRKSCATLGRNPSAIASCIV